MPCFVRTCSICNISPPTLNVLLGIRKGSLEASHTTNAPPPTPCSTPPPRSSFASLFSAACPSSSSLFLASVSYSSSSLLLASISSSSSLLLASVSCLFALPFSPSPRLPEANTPRFAGSLAPSLSEEKEKEVEEEHEEEWQQKQ
eukprot:gb/GEZN01012486.1/.p3 GENE.gb/GEZN01012486.1/~~gb/GEZN01012486.1/.p3  ORF type:complete len:145 (-),score=51.05 gb/GEZN01012486.1/:453-887(-)